MEGKNRNPFIMDHFRKSMKDKYFSSPSSDSYYLFVSIFVLGFIIWSLMSIVNNYGKGFVGLTVGDVLPFVLLFVFLLFFIIYEGTKIIWKEIIIHGYVISEKIDDVIELVEEGETRNSDK